MSAITWLDEFYPVPAGTFEDKRRTKKNLLKALEHSILKWNGFYPPAQGRHGIVLESYYLRVDVNVFLTVSGDSCALCQIVGMAGGGGRIYHCTLCPLFKVRGNVECDEPRPRERKSPYHMLSAGESPARMLYWLRRAKKMVEGDKGA